MSEGIVIALIGLLGIVLTGIFELIKSFIETYAPKIPSADAALSSQDADNGSRAQSENPRPNRARLAALAILLLICAASGAAVFWRYFTVKSSLPVYAVLYDDGSLVFQHGDQPDILKLWTERKNTYSVDMEKGYAWNEDKPTAPWYSEREFIQEVVFADAIQPKSTAYWFYGFRNMKSVKGIARLDTSNVTSMNSMFWNCNSLAKLDVSRFDTANVTDMNGMFGAYEGTNQFAELDVSGFKTDKVKSMRTMFQNCVNLKTLDLSGFNTANVTNMRSMFSTCSSLTGLDVSNFNTSNVTDMHGMFGSCNSLTELDVSNFNTANVTNMRSMFSTCNSLTELDVSNFNTANVTDMGYMFRNCNSLTRLDVSRFDTANVTDMSRMFWNCNSLTRLDVSRFDTANVTDMSYMFGTYEAQNQFAELDVSGFKTAKVTNMSTMFQNCVNLKSLDLRGFNTENVTNMGWMFSGCENLAAIYASDQFVTSQAEESQYMFSHCFSLKGDKGTVYDANCIDKTYAQIDGGSSSPGYFSAKS